MKKKTTIRMLKKQHIQKSEIMFSWTYLLLLPLLPCAGKKWPLFAEGTPVNMGRVKKKRKKNSKKTSTEKEHNWGEIKSTISEASLLKSEPGGLSIVGKE